MLRRILFAATLVAGCSRAPSVVLVHGAWMGGAGWSPTADQLRDRGADVTVLDLPAHGADTAPPGQATLDAYVARVSSAIDAAPKPVVLVGHSMGGVVISQVADQRGDIDKLVFVAAYVPTSGQSLLDLAMADPDAQIGPSLQFNQDGTVGVAQDAFPDLFCADCTAAARATLVASYRAEPGAPLQQPVTLGAREAAVPKIYIHTSRDRVISPALQARMTAATPMNRELTLDTSHAAMLAMPDELADAVLE